MNNKEKTETEKETLNEFAKNIKALRTSLNLSQKEFIKPLGITSQALSSYEKGTQNPSLVVAEKIAKSYNVSIDWLCGLTDDKRSNSKCETYSDIIKKLIEIDESYGLLFETINIGLEMLEEYDYHQAMYFKSDKLEPFIKEWSKMNELLKDGNISRRVYNLWIIDKLEEYNQPIKNDTEEQEEN